MYIAKWKWPSNREEENNQTNKKKHVLHNTSHQLNNDPISVLSLDYIIERYYYSVLFSCFLC
jgi:hypothetical protein